MLLPHLEELVESGHKALVFSQFTKHLAVVRKHVEALGLEYAYLDGSTRDRESVVKRFREDAGCPLLLMSLKAGGLGLNLVEGGLRVPARPLVEPGDRDPGPSTARTASAGRARSSPTA